VIKLTSIIKNPDTRRTILKMILLEYRWTSVSDIAVIRKEIDVTILRDSHCGMMLLNGAIWNIQQAISSRLTPITTERATLISLS